MAEKPFPTDPLNPYAAPENSANPDLFLARPAKTGILFGATLLMSLLLVGWAFIASEPLWALLLIGANMAVMRTWAWNWSRRAEGHLTNWFEHLRTFFSSLGLAATTLVIGVATFLVSFLVLCTFFVDFDASDPLRLTPVFILLSGASLAFVMLLSWRHWPK